MEESEKEGAVGTDFTVAVHCTPAFAIGCGVRSGATPSVSEEPRKRFATIYYSFLHLKPELVSNGTISLPSFCFRVLGARSAFDM